MTHDIWLVFCTDHDYEGRKFFRLSDDPLEGSKRGEITSLIKSMLMNHDNWSVFCTECECQQNYHSVNKNTRTRPK